MVLDTFSSKGHIIKKLCFFSEKWPAAGPAEGTPYLYYKKSVFFLKNGRPEALPKGLHTYIIKKCVFFSEKWPAGGPAEGAPGGSADMIHNKHMAASLFCGQLEFTRRFCVDSNWFHWYD